jgi:hypothetical protein
MVPGQQAMRQSTSGLLKFMNPVRLETVQERIRNMKPGESLLVYHRADLSDLLRQSENTGKERKTTFVCTRCGRPVWQSDSNSRRICTCKCLTAIFSPPYKILSAKQWTQWSSRGADSDCSIQIFHIQGDADRAGDLVRRRLDPTNRAINQDGNERCWCAFCKQRDQEVAVANPWFSRGSKLEEPSMLAQEGVEELVCTYNLCKFCATAMEHGRGSFRSRMADRIQLNLLQKYPSLQSKVPSSRIGFLELQTGCDFLSSNMTSNVKSSDSQCSRPNCFSTTRPFAFYGKRSNGRSNGFNRGRATKPNRRRRGNNGR